MMDADEQADVYYQELVALTERFKEEFDVTYVQLLGVLEMYKMEIFCEAMSVMMDDDDTDEEFSDGND